MDEETEVIETVEILDTEVVLDGKTAVREVTTTGGTIHVSFRIRDMDRFRLFMWELQSLRDEMRVMASPHAERLERLIDRFMEGGDDESPESTED